ncbi:MAG TPA: chemotaxis protein CheW [Rhodanobacteraceae bacterium]|nr:chemotaxis protein CheW [Rhodanobacteraceae bacterium]
MVNSPEQFDLAAGPFDALADYERRSLAHVAGAPEQVDAQGLWRGIGFRVGARRFISGIGEINELLLMPVLTLVPGTRPWLLGVANVRGNLVPITDLNQYLYGERTQLTDRSRVLLVRQGGGATGLLVDEVLGQRNLTDEQRVDAGDEEDERLQRFVAENVRLGEQSWGVFDMSSLVNANDFQQAAV